MVHRPVAVSAPGKVLLAGGYLVLDRAHTGLVFGLDARIHVLVENVPTEHGVKVQEITVRSPQFKDAVWEYGYRLAEEDRGIDVIQLRAYVVSTSRDVLRPFMCLLCILNCESVAYNSSWCQ